jgi:putative DNA primase/helicase
MEKGRRPSTPPPVLAVVDDKLPELLVMATNPHETANALVAQLLPQNVLFRRDDHLVRVVTPDDGSPPSIKPASLSSIIDDAHRLTRPVKRTKGDDGKLQVQRCPLPRTVPGIVQERLNVFPKWRAFTNAPLLLPDGGIRVLDGYDHASGLFGLNPINVDVPPDPTEADAKAALRRVRGRFQTFPFEDSPTVSDGGGVNLVDLSRDPGGDESALLVGLLSAFAAPSLDFVPGLVINAASLSGSGSGKSLLMQAVARIAHGNAIPSVSATKVVEELEKKLASTLIRGHAMLFVQNYNGKVLQSDLIASAITDRPFDLRRLGTTESVTIDATIFFGCTGNAIVIGEDMIRRVLRCDLDAKMDEPEQRKFKPGFLDGISADRSAILSDLLTIYRWGCRYRDLPHGQPSGSFEMWARLIRDPLLALGCRDVVARQSELKRRDPGRRNLAELFEAWWDEFHNQYVLLSQLTDKIKELIDPGQKRPKKIANYINGLRNTQQGGFRFEVIEPAGKWSANQYTMTKIEEEKPAAPESPAATAPAQPESPADIGDDEDPPPPPVCAQCGSRRDPVVFQYLGDTGDMVVAP